MSFRTKGLPGVAESTVFYSEGNLSHGEKVPARADEGVRDKDSFPAVTDCLQGIPFSLRAILKLQNLGFQFSHQNHTKKSFQGEFLESED